MVEQEHSQSSTVFPKNISSNKSTVKDVSKLWLTDNISFQKSEEFYDSDIVNIELLPDISVASQDMIEIKKEDIDMYFETVPGKNRIFSQNNCYNDTGISYFDDYSHVLIADEQDLFSSDIYVDVNSPDSFFGNATLDTAKLNEAFKVDKDEIDCSPTLAELNANNNEAVFDSVDSFCMSLLSHEKLNKNESFSISANSNSLQIAQKEMPPQKDTSQTKLCPKIYNATNLINLPFVKDSASNIKNGNDYKYLKCSYAEYESINEIKQYLDSKSPHKIANKPNNLEETDKDVRSTSKETCKKATEEKRTVHTSTPVSYKEDSFDSEDDDSEMDYDFSTDNDEESEDVKNHSSKQVCTNGLLFQKKNSRYFWQYNIQSKGPKTPKASSRSCAVPDNAPGISDPNFSSCYLNSGIKHASKVRRGDGNDLTPNPQKLFNIGIELKKLNSKIDGLVPANELPLSERTRFRKEKNKLASRACRLKKKAQHEANKLKLYGLQKEKKYLLEAIRESRQIIRSNIDDSVNENKESILLKILSLTANKCSTEVAGRTAEFVNKILKNVELGVKNGGLEIDIIED